MKLDYFVSPRNGIATYTQCPDLDTLTTDLVDYWTTGVVGTHVYKE